MIEKLENKPWWSWVHEDLRELMSQSVLLINIFDERLKKPPTGKTMFHDYAFIVFPAAKAYEGFLKTLFLELNFINSEDYYGKRFRIGKALNPALEPEIRERESVYDKLKNYCRSRELPDKLWQTWKNGRNKLFHWFPNETNAINFNEAKSIVEDIVDSMDFAFEGCKLNSTSEKEKEN
jgi:hypothetical protein